MVDRLTHLITVFEDKLLDFSKNRAEGDDILGDAYEYLMRYFATESGKSKGQFYTPAEVSRVIAQILSIRHARTTNDTTVYDPTCGSGSLLLKVADEAGAQGTLYGQLDPDESAHAARTILSCRGTVDGFPIARTYKGWLNHQEIVRFARDLNEIHLVEIDWSDLEPFLAHLELKHDVIAAFTCEPPLDRDAAKQWLGSSSHTWRWWSEEMFSPVGEVMRALSESWNVALDDVLDSVEFRTDDDELIEVEIGSANGKPYVYRAAVITRL